MWPTLKDSLWHCSQWKHRLSAFRRNSGYTMKKSQPDNEFPCVRVSKSVLFPFESTWYTVVRFRSRSWKFNGALNVACSCWTALLLEEEVEHRLGRAVRHGNPWDSKYDHRQERTLSTILLAWHSWLAELAWNSQIGAEKPYLTNGSSMSTSDNLQPFNVLIDVIVILVGEKTKLESVLFRSEDMARANAAKVEEPQERLQAQKHRTCCSKGRLIPAKLKKCPRILETVRWYNVYNWTGSSAATTLARIYSSII